ncbi:MAG: hypothetical protein D6728_02465 [Cyanobacteria bacterium J055]|nr:MAG: hypothetical protein D6728_02465 [Cyanobacteria bacterium J055]
MFSSIEKNIDSKGNCFAYTEFQPIQKPRLDSTNFYRYSKLSQKLFRSLSEFTVNPILKLDGFL